MNERLKKLRKELGLTLDKFGEPLGVGKTAISKLEKGENNITDQMCKSICRTYNVNEDWLRYGIEPMTTVPDNFSLDEYAQKNNISDIDFKIIKAFMEIDPDARNAVYDKLKDIFSGEGSDNSAATSESMSVKDAEDFYKKSRSVSAQKEILSASSTNEDNDKKASNQ